MVAQDLSDTTSYVACQLDTAFSLDRAHEVATGALPSAKIDQ